MSQNTQNKNSPQELQRKVDSGRHNLLLVMIFTVINLVLLLTNANRYFLFSASVPYYLTVFGLVWDGVLEGASMGTFTITALVISGVILSLYLLCWLLAKKQVGWYVVAAVLFAADTAFLLWVNMDALMESLLDLVFHAWVLAGLVQSIVCHK